MNLNAALTSIEVLNYEKNFDIATEKSSIVFTRVVLLKLVEFTVSCMSAETT